MNFYLYIFKKKKNNQLKYGLYKLLINIQIQKKNLKIIY